MDQGFGSQIETVRPEHPVVHALSGRDVGGSFLELLHDVLAPGIWSTPEPHGFSWIPYRLKHRLEYFERPGRRPVCRSTLLVLDSVGDDLGAMAIAAELNRRAIGGVVWFDAHERTLSVTSSVHLDASTWWNAFIFQAVLGRLVGICERLAPRLARALNAKVAVARHARRGMRSDPDFLYEAHDVETYAPEGGTGLWWSEEEIDRFRAVWEGTARLTDAELRWPTGDSRRRISALRMGGEMIAPLGSGHLSLAAGQTDHPDFGFGFQVLLTSSIQFGSDGDGNGNETILAPTLRYINDLNRGLAHYCPAGITISGWTAWDNRLEHATFLTAEIARTLQQLAVPTAGDVFGLLSRDLVDNSPADVSPAPDDDWCHSPFSAGRGVENTSWPNSLLLDDTALLAELMVGVPANVTLRTPKAMQPEAWPIRHTRTVATVGIFNPMGPSVGTLEILCLGSPQRTVLFERVRHATQPTVRLWAIVGSHNSGVVAQHAEEVASRLDWGPFDWVIVHDYGPVGQAFTRGLHTLGASGEWDAAAARDRLLSSVEDPWLALTSRLPMQATVFTSEPSDDWVRAVTDPVIVDARVAHIREAWEGAVAFIADPDGNSAGQVVEIIRAEIEARRQGLPGRS